MRPGIRCERLCGLLLVVAVWSHGAPAQAGLIGGTHDSIPLGNTAALTGGAGLAIFQDGDAAWYNVAGLGGVSRSSLSVSGTGLLVRLRAVPDLLAIDAGQGYRTAASLESNEFMSVPSMIVSVWNLTEGLTLGVGFFAPEVEFLTTRLSLEVGFPSLDR